MEQNKHTRLFIILGTLILILFSLSNCYFEFITGFFGYNGHSSSIAIILIILFLLLPIIFLVSSIVLSKKNILYIKQLLLYIFLLFEIATLIFNIKVAYGGIKQDQRYFYIITFPIILYSIAFVLGIAGVILYLYVKKNKKHSDN
ncbi:MAG: hypothetical protein LBV51_00100 [Acholeplasmatales bacterium]|jgi:uncharacterized membrane protein YtjA (UPF0391 family)|nr:hypothetical protein [Acholeplasmatales bacterium]